jgi:hypothetical protein
MRVRDGRGGWSGPDGTERRRAARDTEDALVQVGHTAVVSMTAWAVVGPIVGVEREGAR